MTRTLHCVNCGATRTVDTNRPHRESPSVPGTKTTCFRCGQVVFTTDPTNCPQFCPGWLVTEHDRLLLWRYSIARGSEMVRSTERNAS